MIRNCLAVLQRRLDGPARLVLLPLVSVALLGFWLGNLAMLGLAQGQTKIRLNPSTSQVQVGNTISVDIVIENVTDLYGLDVRLSFDPALLEVQDADPGTAGVQIQKDALPAPDFVVKNEADNRAGTIWYAVTQLNPTEPVSGSGAAASITFKGLANGTSLVAFTYQKMAKRDGEQITATTQNGQIMVVLVGAAPTSTPTPKPKPTDTPLPTPTPIPPTTAPPTEAPTVTSPTAIPTSRLTSTQTTISEATGTPPPTSTPMPPTKAMPTETPTIAPPTATPTSRPTSAPTPTTGFEVAEAPLPTPTSTIVPPPTVQPEIAEEEAPSSTPFPTIPPSNTSGILANGFPYAVIAFLGTTAVVAILAIVRLRKL